MTPLLAPLAILFLAAPQTAPAAGAPTSLTIWDFAVKGGPAMILIAACSLVALAVIAERLILTRRRTVAPPDLAANVKAAAGEPARALDLCRASASALGTILTTAVRHRAEPKDFIKQAVADTGKREIVRLRHRMRLLGALPQVATMLGLFGTILGMIKTFQAVAASGQSLGKTELLARGIFEAWACTAAGLMVAIPTIIMYHVLMGRIDGRVAELDRIASDFIEDTPFAAEPHRPATAATSNGAATALAGTTA